MDFLAVLKSVIQTLSANYIWESHGLFVWWCLFFPWIPLHHFHYHKQCCNGKAVADLIKKLSNNVKNPLEIQAPEWRGLMTARELSLQSTTPVGCVWALVVFYRIISCLCVLLLGQRTGSMSTFEEGTEQWAVCAPVLRGTWLGEGGSCLALAMCVPCSLPRAVQCCGWSLHGRQLCLLCPQQRLTLTESFHWDTGKKSFGIYIVCWCFEPKSSLLCFPLGCVSFAREAGSIYEALRTSAIFLEFVLFCLWPSLWVLCCFCYRCVLQTDPLAGNPEFGKTEILFLFL